MQCGRHETLTGQPVLLCAEAAVIAIPDAKWGERPLLVVAPKPGQVRAGRAGSKLLKSQ